MGLFKSLFSPHRHSASIAKERLKIVLAHERAGRGAPDFLPKLQKELIDVVGRYVEIREDMISTCSSNSSRLAFWSSIGAPKVSTSRV